ncbi:PH domain-containing protein [Gordonia sp. HY285]|uniref:PH domain-containing protein n=1 Tax=Gordonia liuliyuniae TaxID=2911517 RepID=A0ABS9IVF4_9ACTN|nr:PH domain-containing protein [Gordonia liuliyuniae]MCF8589536.1 PH domain-containing protein [Gordonia liuliyuniae]MCF8589946.1 PH domain-containing protein [Gordonia liuliyuniae]MCF8611492.1 PH domain-containing protein [Gordonia liuliyuniae]
MVAVTDSVFDFKISRLAYAGVLVSVLLVVIMMGGSLWFGFLAVVPVALVWWINRLHTHVDADGIVAVGTFSEQSVSWDDVAGLRFPKWSSVRAVTVDGDDIRLPAVGFDDVPQLSLASGGRVPDPFAAEREARRSAPDKP